MCNKYKLFLIVILGLFTLPLYASNLAANKADSSETASTAQTVLSNKSDATATTPANHKLRLKNEIDKLSYTLGAELGENLKNQGINLNPTIFIAGLTDSIEGNKLQLSKFAMRETEANFQKQLISQRESQFKQVSKQNEQQGQAFLATNASQPGIQVLPSGLQYKIVTPGRGSMPSKDDIVTVSYTGSFINGTVFDSSLERGQPATFPVSGVIPGWQQALKMMQPGATWELFIPPRLAYGEQGMGDVIGPNQTLIFKVQLISIKSKNA